MLSIEQIQKIELEGLKELHCFCENNNLTYLLAFGTLLGAVRHNGFIPWDNDVDVYMPRNDYEKLLYLTSHNNYKISNNWEIIHFSNNEHYHYDIIRLCNTQTRVKADYIRDKEVKMGVWIDIFALDGIHKNPIVHPLFYVRMQWYSRLESLDLYYQKEDLGFLNKIKGLIFLLFIKNRKIMPAQKVDEIAKKVNCELSEKLATYGVDTMKTKMPFITREDVKNKKLIKFEDELFYIPDNANRLLESVYGNWRELPPIEKRVVHQIEVNTYD